MSDRLLVATRKGLFDIRLQRKRWQIANVSFLGVPVTMCLRDPRDGTLHAALDHGHFGAKMHRSSNDGKTFEEVPAPSFAGSAAEGEAPSLKLVWALEAAGGDEPGVLWAGTIPGGLFKSEDGGKSWQLNKPLWEMPERKQWFGGGAEQPGIHSICIDPRGSKRLSLAVSCGGVWLTDDGGESWSVRSKGLWAEYTPPDQKENPLIQDPHRMVQCAAAPESFWIQHHNGIFRCTDGLQSWQDVLNVKPSNFGFPVAVHPNDPDTAWFVPAADDAARYPVDGHVVVTRTRDGGKSFEVLDDGLPDDNAYDLVYRHGLAIDETGERLAFGSTTGSLWITENGGDNWREISTHLPPIYAVRFAGG